MCEEKSKTINNNEPIQKMIALMEKAKIGESKEKGKNQYCVRIGEMVCDSFGYSHKNIDFAENQVPELATICCAIAERILNYGRAMTDDKAIMVFVGNYLTEKRTDLPDELIDAMVKNYMLHKRELVNEEMIAAISKLPRILHMGPQQELWYTETEPFLYDLIFKLAQSKHTEELEESEIAWKIAQSVLYHSKWL